MVEQSIDMSQVPIIINNRDRLEPLVQLITWLERAGQRNIIIVDNASAYPPLLSYYRRCHHTVIQLGQNIGHLAAWTQGIVERYAADQYYVVTDPDIVPVDYCPTDALAHFRSILDRHPDRLPDRLKVGFGLKIDDLPDHYKFAKVVRAWESQFWEKPVEPGVYEAPIDSTFALYRPGAPHNDVIPALRTGDPYVARHTPWYSNSARLDREERYYREHTRADVNNWDGAALPDRLYTLMANAGIAVPQLGAAGDQRSLLRRLFGRAVRSR